MRLTIRDRDGQLDLSMVLFILASAGMAVNYIYFSTIGSWEAPVESLRDLLFSGLGFLGAMAVGGAMDLVFSAIRKHRKAGCNHTAAALLLLLMMTSFFVPTGLFLGAAVLLSLLNQLKLPLSFSTVAVYFLLVFASHSLSHEAPFLSAPYLQALGGDFADFRREFYSVTVVAAGIASGPLSFNLLLPILAGAVMLANRKYGPMLWSLLFFFVFSAAALAFFGTSDWRLPLFLLNGSVFMVGVFFMPWELKAHLPFGSKLAYAILLGVATFLFSYHVHFIWGPYLAFLLVCLLMKLGNLVDRLEDGPSPTFKRMD
ncbi:MAG: hypothetical protein FWF59_14860 [Turicibacter sp.]|nr:hypothetical protein [Turicibacter sp.]